MQRKQQFKAAIRKKDYDFMYSKVFNYMYECYKQYDQKLGETRDDIFAASLEAYYEKSKYHKEVLHILHDAAYPADQFKDVKRVIDIAMTKIVSKIFEVEALA